MFIWKKYLVLKVVIVYILWPRNNSGYLSKGPKNMYEDAFIRMLVMVFMIGKETEAIQTIGNLVVGEL